MSFLADLWSAATGGPGPIDRLLGTDPERAEEIEPGVWVNPEQDEDDRDPCCCDSEETREWPDC